MSDVKIRQAARDELAAIVQIYNMMWTKSESPLDLKMAENFFYGVERHPNHHMYVADSDGRIVGAFTLLVGEEADDGIREGILENVVVHPKFQHMGVGKGMLSFAIAACKAAHCGRLVQPLSEKRRIPQTFYESHGFRREGYRLVLPLERDA